MRTFHYFLLLATILLASCHGKTEKETITESMAGETSEKSSTDISFQHDSIYQTSTGKIFHVLTEPDGESVMEITVIGKGFPNSNDSIRFADTDPLNKVILLDLNKDGFDEIYLVTMSAGSGSYANIYGVSSNKDLSYTPITVQQISEKDLKDENLFQGYMGHDSIYASDQHLLRKFPVYMEGDANCCPTGGFRILAYSLFPGEAAWQLKIK